MPNVISRSNKITNYQRSTLRATIRTAYYLCTVLTVFLSSKKIVRFVPVAGLRIIADNAVFLGPISHKNAVQ